MRDGELIILSLTGPASHVIDESLRAGLRIGPAHPERPAPDLVVGVDDAINWSAFGSLGTNAAGYAQPGWLTYHGNDLGVFTWARTHRLQELEWTPAAAARVDASQAQISKLKVNLRTVPLDIVLAPRSRCAHLIVVGDPALLRPDLAPDAPCPYLSFYPDSKPTRDADPLRLPPFPALAGATSVVVYVVPLRQAFDCASLLQFPRLTGVSLRGELTGLAALAHLPDLVEIIVNDCPDLSDLPPLATWPALKTILVANVDEATGKRLRTEIRHLTKTAGRVWRFASATRLRRPEWFTTEYGLPFSRWPEKMARVAVKAYRTAEADISAADSPDDVRAAITTFVHVMNPLPDMETIEREDAAEAVVQLATRAPFKIEADLVLSWFDAERDF